VSELSFLISLLLEHKLGKKTKDAIQARIKEIEVQPPQRGLAYQQAHIQHPQRSFDSRGVGQAPSMQAKIEAMEAEKEAIARGEIPPQPIPVGPPPSSAAAAQALALRQNIIQGALGESGGNFEPGRKAARKF
jgi:hypothetical protein